VTGTVEAIRRVHPGSKLLGRVAVVAVREGEAVRQGQVLARIESADLEANLARARAAVAQAQAELDNASAQQQRYEALAARGSVTPRALEDVTTRLQVAAAALDQARAAARAAEVQLGYAVLTSPLEGWVVERRVEAGDMVAPGAVLFTLEDLRQVKVVVEIPEEAVARGTGKTGSAVEVAILGENYPGVIGHLLPAGNPASRTFAAHIFLENPQGTLKSGMFARVRLEPPASQRSDFGWTTPELWVPATALVRRGQMEGLYVVDESAAPPRARLRWLRVGADRDGAVQILAGLEPGERFLPTPPADLAEGAPLRVIRVEGPAEVPAGEVSHD
jgi:RND family efflux transporter MFP subunit